MSPDQPLRKVMTILWRNLGPSEMASQHDSTSLRIFTSMTGSIVVVDGLVEEVESSTQCAPFLSQTTARSASLSILIHRRLRPQPPVESTLRTWDRAGREPGKASNLF
jgi:hypothetical protein